MQMFCTSEQEWRIKNSPILFHNWYGGEDYDACAETEGWNQPGTDQYSTFILSRQHTSYTGLFHDISVSMALHHPDDLYHHGGCITMAAVFSTQEPALQLTETAPRSAVSPPTSQLS